MWMGCVGSRWWKTKNKAREGEKEKAVERGGGGWSVGVWKRKSKRER